MEKASSALEVVWSEFARSHLEEQRTLTPRDAVKLGGANLDAVIEEPILSQLAEVFATAILVHSPEPIENALEAVRAATEVRPVGLISDTGVSPGSSLRRLLDRHHFTPFFRSMTYSDEVGVSKPRRPMFETAARSLGVAPHELLHIGDLERTDIAGAKGVGARAVLFAGEHHGGGFLPSSHRPESLNHTQADYVFSAWSDFIKRLPALLA